MINISKVREGVVIKVRRDVYEKLVRLSGSCMARLGRKFTYSDIIDALIKSNPDPVEVVKKYAEKKR